MHRKPSFRSEITIFTQNTQNAPKTEFSIGNQDFHPKHAECTENRVFDLTCPGITTGEYCTEPDLSQESNQGAQAGKKSAQHKNR